jgi:hypothetical protein
MPTLFRWRSSLAVTFGKNAGLPPPISGGRIRSGFSLRLFLTAAAKTRVTEANVDVACSKSIDDTASQAADLFGSSLVSPDALAGASPLISCGASKFAGRG